MKKILLIIICTIAMISCSSRHANSLTSLREQLEANAAFYTEQDWDVFAENYARSIIETFTEYIYIIADYAEYDTVDFTDNDFKKFVKATQENERIREIIEKYDDNHTIIKKVDKLIQDYDKQMSAELEENLKESMEDYFGIENIEF